MRILFLDQFSDLGGAQIGLCEILDETLRRGWQPMVMAPGTGPLHRECTNRGIPSRDLPLSRYANGGKTAAEVFRFGVDSLRCASAIQETARQFEPHLVYVNGPRPLLAASLAAAPVKTPVIFHAHSFLDRQYTKRIARWCVARSGMRVIAISRFVAQPFGEARLIYNGVKDHGFVARARVTGVPAIGIVGRISPEKGQLDFVAAARTMAASPRSARFLIFGGALFSDDAYERQVRAAARGLPVEFRGWTNDVAGALHEIDILAVPSGPAEGATRVIMEAFSAGTPVVAHPSGGIPELIRHGETGLLTRSLAEAFRSLLDEPAMMERFSVQGRREWEERFQLERCQRDLCDFIEEVCATTSARHCQSAAAAPERGERLGSQ